MTKKRPILLTRLITGLATRLFHIWFSTCRVNIIGQEVHRRYFLGNEKAVGATWHKGAIFLVWFFRKLRPMVMVSKSEDGDLIAGFAERLGAIPARGSSSRGGRDALKKMLDYLKKTPDAKVATVMDGPRGPRLVAKKGMILLAMFSGVPLIPVVVSANPAITFTKAWDRTIIPLPFSKVTILYGKPWSVPRRMSEDQLEDFRFEVETTLNRMLAEADRDTGYAIDV
ncbi:MAG: lysophospholipid acyltransferase family protein [Desulfobacteraceae bacterium]|nr:lysophospholipid acyltransferase family protein [Desulfobacteraceae bacterium]